MVRLNVKYDGKVLIPIGPVDFVAGQELEIQVLSDAIPAKGTGAAIRKALESAPIPSDEAMADLERSLEAAKAPGSSRGIFDDMAD